MNVKLNPNTTLNIYKKNMPSTAKADEGKTAAAGEKANIDTISISPKAADQLDAAKLAKSIAGEVAQENASPARLNELRAQIEAGDYNVAPDEIAQSILGSFLA